jgi:hypothetical protein
MDLSVALWVCVPLALVHLVAWRHRSLLLFQVAVDVGLLLLPGRLLLQGLHIGPGAPGAAEWGGNVTVTGSPEYSDFPLQLAVWWEETRRLAAAGEPPWISDRLGGGTALLANGQTQIPFPLQLPVWVLGAERGNDVMALWKIELAALGGFFLMRRLRVRPAPAAAAAFAYSFGLYPLSWLCSPISWITAAAPWTWWLLIGTLRGSKRNAAGLAFLLGVLAGWSIHPESATLLWLALGLGGLVLASGRWRRVRRMVVPFLVAVAVAGVGALPTLATLRDSPKLTHMKSGSTYPTPGVGWALRGRIAALVLVPWRDGHPSDGTWIHHFPAAPVSTGVGCVMVACLLCLRRRRRFLRPALAFGVTGAVGVALFLQIPGFAQVMGRVPVIAVMVWPRAAFLVSLAIAITGGMGADAVLRSQGRKSFAAAALLVFLGVMALALTAPAAVPRRWALEAGLFPLFAAVLAPVLTRLGGAILPALVLAEVLSLGWKVPAGALMPASQPPIVEKLRECVSRDGGRILGLGTAFPPNLTARLGFADLRSNSPVRPLALARLHRALGAEGMDLPGPVTKPWAGLAGAWGVRWLATPPQGLSGACAFGWQEVYRDGGGRLYRNTRMLPVVRLASRMITPPGDPGTGAWEGLDFATTAVVDTPIGLGGRGTIAEVENSPSRYVAHVRVRGRVLAVLHAPYAPGWRASLDGRAVPLVDADIAAMGVVVGDGDHEVRWEYTPPGLGVGVGLTLAGLAACLLLSLSSPRRRC